MGSGFERPRSCKPKTEKERCGHLMLSEILRWKSSQRALQYVQPGVFH
jgi:hypothetical protein